VLWRRDRHRDHHRPRRRVSAFEKLEQIKPLVLREGITGRAVNGERVTLAVVDLDPGAHLPEHHHENEQLGFVIKGEISFRIGKETRTCHPGDAYAIASDVPHEATAGPQGCTVCDVFAPIRADWEKLERKDPHPGRWP
jgi:quercetin dioxygenase-like cupin family protein